MTWRSCVDLYDRLTCSSFSFDLAMGLHLCEAVSAVMECAGSGSSAAFGSLFENTESILSVKTVFESALGASRRSLIWADGVLTDHLFVKYGNKYKINGMCCCVVDCGRKRF